MTKLTLDYHYVLPFVSLEEIKSLEEVSNQCREKLLKKTGKGNDFVDWVKWPQEITNDEIAKINACAHRLQNLGQYLVVCGIGGSYLGAKAGIDMLKDYYRIDEYKVIFSGNSFSSTENYQLLEFLKDKDFSLVVISKSGKTTETAISFRFLKELLKEKYPQDYNKRIVAITSNANSALHTMALNEKYEEFFIPSGIGGRYSVLTAVGLLPFAFKNYDIEMMIKGSRDAYNHFSQDDFLENEAMLYAAIRNLLYKKNINIEILGFYEPKMRNFGEWWKQLYGESEGKEHQGIFPSSVIYSTDLHSLGQYVQDGRRNIMETIVNIVHPSNDLTIKNTLDNLDGLNYLNGKSLDFVNKQAMKGTIIAHSEGMVPNICLTIDDVSEYSFGYMAYFFMFACGISGYLLDVNPFDQQGVEAYKNKMFELLKK